jgi:hypothetical protein
MTNELIAQARRRYLAENPLRVTDVPAHTRDGSPTSATFPIPNMDDMGVIGCKLGMEYLAICHDEEAVEDWIHNAMRIAPSPELAAVLFANVFRGVNVVIGSIIDNKGLREQMEKMALEAWGRDFSGPEDGAA